MHSWRAVVWAYGSPEFAARYDFSEPWNSPANLAAAQPVPVDLWCHNSQNSPACSTNYAAILDGDRCSLDSAGQGGPNKRRIVIVEVPDSTILWTEPRDVTLEEIARFPPPHDPGGLAAVFSDGSYRRLSIQEILAPEILDHWTRHLKAARAKKSPDR
ncbi:hypothetical protein PZE19_04785 [Paludisphaera sp. Pla2]|uniref:Caudovirus prohead protease n=2 Tax=Paludisphaera mucosa TaxID=3030827 RepID=A0ABT6F6D4_9BACT|nr:hypothetical protein [Paludisphaera mucosa]MDG3003074.1 hypothetical protein [Paludisphaera mucosa]